MDQQAMQEKIKNMSPEELMEFQKQQCIFCHIIEGKVEAKKVYEDNIVLAVLDINPANPGHILLLPKEHYAIMPQIPEEELGHMFLAVRELSNSLLKALGVEGTNIFIANGAAAGQRAQHFMIHIIPRADGDNVTLEMPKKEIPAEQMEQIRKTVASAVSKITGVKAPQQNMVDAEFTEAPGQEKPEGQAQEQEMDEPEDESLSEPEQQEEQHEEPEQPEEASSKEQPKEEQEEQPEEKAQETQDEKNQEEKDEDAEKEENRKKDDADLDKIADVLFGKNG
mgnify:CR=1 FL=1